MPNSVDPDEMPHSVAFHLGLHCLPKHMFTGFHDTKSGGFSNWLGHLKF